MSVSNNLEYFRQRVAQTPGVYIPEDSIDVRFYVAKTIVLARLEAGYSQDVLAARAGLAQTAIVRIESGFSNPTITTPSRVAAALGKTITLSDMKDL